MLRSLRGIADATLRRRTATCPPSRSGLATQPTTCHQAGTLRSLFCGGRSSPYVVAASSGGDRGSHRGGPCSSVAKAQYAGRAFGDLAEVFGVRSPTRNPATGAIKKV